MTDVTSFNFLEPKADAFRNYVSAEESASPTHLLIDRASQLDLSAPEMAVLLGGMRVMGCNFDGSKHGVFTEKPGSLGNDFFVNLLDSPDEWRVADGQAGLYQAHRLSNDEVVSRATAVDLVFGSNSQLRAIAEVYASNDAGQLFIEDFVAAWHKVMNLDRFARA